MKVLFKVQVSRDENNVWKPVCNETWDLATMDRKLSQIVGAKRALMMGKNVPFTDAMGKRSSYRIVGTEVKEPQELIVEISEVRKSYTVRRVDGAIVERAKFPPNVTAMELERHLFHKYGTLPILHLQLG